MNALEDTNKTIPFFTWGGRRYRCKVVHVYDGDTVHVVIEFGGGFVKLNVRLTGIDTPEMRPPRSQEDRDVEKRAAIQTRNRVASLVTGQEVDPDLHSIDDVMDNSRQLVWLDAGEDDKYGRVLGRLVLDDGRCVNDVLIEEGYAAPYDGGTKRAFSDYWGRE